MIDKIPGGIAGKTMPAEGGAMRTILCFLGTILLGGGFSVSRQQPSRDETCKFTVQGETAKPTITGPQGIVRLVHVVEQPDSPVEITAIDFEGSFLSAYSERYTEQLRCKVKVRNRSNRSLRNLEASVYVLEGGGGTGSIGNLANGLAPGQEAEFVGCGGHGTGGARNDHVRILVSVGWIDLGGCDYHPAEPFPAHCALRDIFSSTVPETKWIKPNLFRNPFLTISRSACTERR